LAASEKALAFKRPAAINLSKLNASLNAQLPAKLENKSANGFLLDIVKSPELIFKLYKSTSMYTIDVIAVK
jgi:hypothetical protein